MGTFDVELFSFSSDSTDRRQPCLYSFFPAVSRLALSLLLPPRAVFCEKLLMAEVAVTFVEAKLFMLISVVSVAIPTFISH